MTSESTIHRELFTREYSKNHSPSHGSSTLYPPILPLYKCERRKEAWTHSLFLLASADVAAQAAGAPVAASLVREINLVHLAISYYTQPILLLFLSLSYNMICISIRGNEPPQSVDYRRLCTYTALQIIDKKNRAICPR